MSAPAPSTKSGFDPAKHLSRVGGSDYLEVKWRLVWRGSSTRMRRSRRS